MNIHGHGNALRAFNSSLIWRRKLCGEVVKKQQNLSLERRNAMERRPERRELEFIARFDTLRWPSRVSATLRWYTSRGSAFRNVFSVSFAIKINQRLKIVGFLMLRRLSLAAHLRNLQLISISWRQTCKANGSWRNPILITLHDSCSLHSQALQRAIRCPHRGVAALLGRFEKNLKESAFLGPAFEKPMHSAASQERHWSPAYEIPGSKFVASRSTEIRPLESQMPELKRSLRSCLYWLLHFLRTTETRLECTNLIWPQTPREVVN